MSNDLNDEFSDNTDDLDPTAADLESVETEGLDELDIPAAPAEDDSVAKAKKNGYLTEEQYLTKHGSLDGFKSPDQFNKYGEAWGEVSEVIKGLQKQVEESRKQTDILVNYQRRTEERAYQRARADLEAQLQDARNVGDIDSIEHLVKEKQKLEFREQQEVAQTHEKQRINVEQAFKENNKHWFGINQEMTQKAIELDAQIRADAQRNNVPLTYESLAKQVEAHMRALYPDTMIRQVSAAPAISSARSGVNKGASGAAVLHSEDKIFSTLGKDHQSMYNAVKRAYEKSSGKEYTKKDFINMLKKDGEI